MQGDSSKSVDFLKRWNAQGPWVLTSISTDRKGISTTTFRADQIKQLTDWIDKYNGDRNIYFSVNSVKGELKSKANKEDIKTADWLHIDIDPAEGADLSAERERALGLLTGNLPKGIPKPTVIVFSGGGYQGFWRLKQPVEIDGDISKAEDFELYNKRLEQIFAGDHCHNVDRIMRLPGTINVPDAKKRKKGRVEELAVLLEFNNNSYDLDEFKKAQGVQTGGPTRDSRGAGVKVPGNVERIADLSELDKWAVSDRTKVIIAQGMHPEQPKEGDNSRSAWVFDCVCALVRNGVPDEVIFSLLTDPDWGISASIIEQKSGADAYAVRQITRAKEWVVDPNLTRMNDKHAIIGNIGGKCRVIEEINDEVLHRARITVSSFEDLRNRYSNIQIKIGETEKGQDVITSLGKFWLGHKMRRQYDTMKFMPQGDEDGVYNLWRGFNVEPRPGDCGLYLDHILHNVCSGNTEHYDYLIKWMARTVQTPASPGEVAIVLRGGKGTGKSLFATIFGRLFGRHFLHVSNPSHLVGNFNAHLRDVIALFSDEAFFAGDKRHESVLKTLVTEDSIPIEAKGLDVETYPNYVHLIMASNDPHVVRATGDERRYYVLDMGEKKKQDKAYFKAMIEQMENGGYEALLYHLQSIDLRGFQVRDVPNTKALQDQKLLSMGVDEEWWYLKLQNGRLMDSDIEWNGDVPCETLTIDFTTHADKWKFTRRGNETALGRFLKRVAPHLTKGQKVHTFDERDRHGLVDRVAKRVYFYHFGTLDQCRKSWEDVYGETEWDEPIQLEIVPKRSKEAF